MSNKRVFVKALLRGQWVVMPGDLVKKSPISSGTLMYGEKAKVMGCFYLEVPIKDSDEVSREAWVNLEIVESPNENAIGLQVSEYLSHLLPGDWEQGKGIMNSGRSFDQFVVDALKGR